jgi:hypothetical protein
MVWLARRDKLQLWPWGRWRSEWPEITVCPGTFPSWRGDLCYIIFMAVFSLPLLNSYHGCPNWIKSTGMTIMMELLPPVLWNCFTPQEWFIFYYNIDYLSWHYFSFHCEIAFPVSRRRCFLVYIRHIPRISCDALVSLGKPGGTEIKRDKSAGGLCRWCDSSGW